MPYNNTEDDEIVTVQLPRRDAKILREIVNRQRAMNWVGKWFTSLLFVLGGLITIFSFWDQIKKVFISIGG